jgi:hypothetical protein
MKRFRPLCVVIASLAALAVALLSAAAALADPLDSRLGYDTPLCQSRTSTCIDPAFNPPTGYVGHDEPSVLFKSRVPGSGNDVTYTITLPKDPQQQPNESGVGGTTWNFELRSTYWFGMTMCDTESAPVPHSGKPCTPDSDKNDLEGTNPRKKDYIGYHPGNAYMELQFYEPGWVPQFEGFGCGATQYCAAMTIDSFSSNQNTGVDNNAACNNYILGGVEPVNWAYVTRSGRSQAPANPVALGTFDDPNFAGLNPDPNQDLMMNPGDTIRMHMYDTPAGFRVDMFDLSTGQHGSMTASIANGFGHILYQPNSSTCNVAPYAFHPEYSTGFPRGNTWSAHTYNVAGSDEIGHFENCGGTPDANGNCTVPVPGDPTLDQDDIFCDPAADSALVHIDGCTFDDEDFDGQSYRNDWPGSNPNPFVDRALHTTPMAFTSATTNNGRTDYSTIAFEADLPRIEADDSQFNPPFCDRTTGANCVNPPAGAQFYPLYTTGRQNGVCVWQQGGTHIPGTTNTFGGSSTTEYGPLLLTAYPTSNNGQPAIEHLYDNFNSGDLRNPCSASKFGGGQH